MKTYSSGELVNIGTGKDITIAEFARVVAATVGYAPVRSVSTPPAPTARRANCSMSAA
jgi:GDP-L-fucose synthase